MKHKIIQIENYLLVVDDSEIKVRDFCYNSIKNTWNEDIILYQDAMPKYHYVGFKKIIAHLPLNNSPILDGVDLLPLIEDDVEKLAKQEYPQPIPYQVGLSVGADMKKEAFIDGYNKAKEKYKYTEEDLKKAMKYASEITNNKMKYMEDYIQSLQQPKMPVTFECETIWINSFGTEVNTNSYDVKDLKRKTILNSQGLTQWVGKYHY
jgi:hypothetical protein